MSGVSVGAATCPMGCNQRGLGFNLQHSEQLIVNMTAFDTGKVFDEMRGMNLVH